MKVDRAGITAFRDMTSLQPARQLIFSVRLEEARMGLFGGSKKKSAPADYSKLEETVFRDCGSAFAAFQEARPDERIYGLALCIDNDATSF